MGRKLSCHSVYEWTRTGSPKKSVPSGGLIKMTASYPRMLEHLKMSCSSDEVRGLFSHARMLVQSVTSWIGSCAAFEKWPARAFCRSAGLRTS